MSEGETTIAAEHEAGCDDAPPLNELAGTEDRPVDELAGNDDDVRDGKHG